MTKKTKLWVGVAVAGLAISGWSFFCARSDIRGEEAQPAQYPYVTSPLEAEESEAKVRTRTEAPLLPVLPMPAPSVAPRDSAIEFVAPPTALPEKKGAATRNDPLAMKPESTSVAMGQAADSQPPANQPALPSPPIEVLPVLPRQISDPNAGTVLPGLIPKNGTPSIPLGLLPGTAAPGTALPLTANPGTVATPEDSFLGLLDRIERNIPLYQTPIDPPLGFTGRSGVAPRDAQRNNRFIPMEDRWRIGFPRWDRYGKGHPVNDDYPYVEGRRWDPFNQNVLKGDYPIFGQNIFLELTATTVPLFELRQVPTGTTPFESTENPNTKDFFGSPNQYFYTQNFFFSFDLFRGDAAFRPADWRVKLTPAFNVNYLTVSELAVVGPDVTDGTTRGRSFGALQEWFLETKLADLGPNYDFLSLRVGSQPFTSDFRGFIFSDINRGVRLFGNYFSNRDQFNLVYFNQLEKDTNSGLNTFRERHQQVVVANYYKQDFIFPGYTAQWSVHYNHDSPTTKFDNNGFLVRPDPVGVFQTHTVDVVYLGWAGDGHINHLNINHAFYWALGHDSLNPLANQSQVINGQMAAIEISYDQDWMRFRTSFFWSSGDRDIRNRRATGFDTILDNPNFAGGEFSYWQRQQLRLFGVNLNQRLSLVPDLRSSKIQGQANFVNPGLVLGNFGVDMELSPRFRLINNANVLWFDSTNPLQQFVYQENMNRFIGVDLSMGTEYRPYLNNNMILRAGLSALVPGQGFQELFNRLDGTVSPQFAGFFEAILTY